MASWDFSAAGVNGLLNQSSKAKMKITMVPYEDIIRNEQNHYSIEDIESLAISIGDVGLREPLEVKALDDGRYMLIGGERRYTAIGTLREQGDTRYDLVPCVVVDMQSIDLPLSDELKELYVLTTTNAEQRDKTDYDIMRQVENLTKIYKELKAAGHPLKGRQRDLIADKLGISATQVQRYTNISANLSPELKADFQEGKMAFTVADAAAKLPEEKQAELKELTADKEEITQKDVRLIAAEPDQKAQQSEVAPEEPSAPSEQPEKETEEQPEVVKREILIDQSILDSLEDKFYELQSDLSEGGVYISPLQEDKLLDALERAEKALIQVQRIIDSSI